MRARTVTSVSPPPEAVSAASRSRLSAVNAASWAELSTVPSGSQPSVPDEMPKV